MAVEGDLKDLGLVSLVQAMCLDRRDATVYLKCKDHDGVIAFKGGEVVHAVVDQLVGEQAVFALLRWTEGSFRLCDSAAIPARTVTTNWNKLLLEGMRQIDEQDLPPLDPVEQPVLTTTELKEDAALEDSLLLLLSKQEQMQMRLVGKESLRYALQNLQTLSEMVNQVTEAADRIYKGMGTKPALSGVVAEVSREHPFLRLLPIHGNFISTPIVLKLYGGWSSDPAGRRETFHQIACAMVRIVEAYTQGFLALFNAPTAAAQCGEASKLFLAEWSRLVQSLQF